MSIDVMSAAQAANAPLEPDHFRSWAGVSWAEHPGENPARDVEEALPFRSRDEYLGWAAAWKSAVRSMEEASRGLTRAHKAAQRAGEAVMALEQGQVMVCEYGWRKRRAREELTNMYAMRRLSRRLAALRREEARPAR